MDLRIISVIEVTTILTCIFGGLGIVLLVGTRSEINRRKRLSKWPTTEGIISGAQVRKVLQLNPSAMNPIARLTSFNPEVIFSYRVGDKGYESTNYRRSHSSNLKKGTWNTFSSKTALSIIRQHPCGKPVKVFYNPADPNEAYLKLPTSTTGNRIRRASGMVFTALALLTIVNSVFMVMYNRDDLAYASSLPALIPASAHDISTDLERNLKLTCKPDNMDADGPGIGYQVSVCSSDEDPGLPVVWIFSRKSVPNKVDFIQVTPGITDKGVDWATLGKVASMTTGVSNSQFVRIWVTQICPAILTRGGETKLSIGRVNYQMYADSYSPKTKVKLEIGTKE